MKCQQVEQLISAFLDSEVTASDWRQAEEHISNCTACKETLQNFQISTSMYQQNLKKAVPSKNLWPELASRLEPLNQISVFDKINQRLRWFFESFILKPPVYIRAALVGFAIVLLAIVLTNRTQQPVDLLKYDLTEKMPEPAQTYPASQEKLDRIHNREQQKRLVLAQELQNYFDASGVLLMDIKNSESEQEQLDVRSIRRTSQNLLEKMVFIKKDLQESKLNDLQNMIENLEVILFDLANLKDTLEKSDIEMLKTTILKQDVLIKIEIFDVKSLELKNNIKLNTEKKQDKKLGI